MTRDEAAAGRPPAETVFSHPGLPPDRVDSWWSRYLSELEGFTETSRSVLEADCAYIVDQGIFGQGEPADDTWPASRARRGLVMGSVQSGKTASMMGTIARSLDRAVDVVVVLAGTRLALWQQTLERLQQQLDPGVDSAEKQKRRILLPKTPPSESIPIASRYQFTRARIQRAMSRRQPVIVVALKHASHLQALARSLQDSVFPEIDELDRPVHLLVVDDEADDGSILDAAVESSLDPLSGNLKQIPRAIADLWAPPSRATPRNLYSTYVGYTATPQANLLQEDDNPLSPRDFLVSLRTPLDRGDTVTRSSTYSEPQGIGHYYTGGEVFYRRGRAANLCIPTIGDETGDLADAIRAFLVAGAVRLSRNPERLGPHSARRMEFESAVHAKALIPNPHSMLFHPSALVEDHFEGAEDILMWAGLGARAQARSMLKRGDAFLPSSLASTLNSEKDLWTSWLDKFQASSNEIHREFNTPAAREIPGWDVVKRLLEEELIPGTRVAVVNSDPAADNRPEYEPTANPDGLWIAPRDMSTIFVAGNVMSRGLTLEGLTTTLFLRSSESPRADSQMQMQRWFGYRGEHIELCRVFASQDQIDFFGSYHDVDEGLRNLIAHAMSDDVRAPDPMVLQGRRFLATGKIANLGNKPLHPGRKPFVPLINDGVSEDPNSALVVGLFAGSASADVTVGGRVRGRILAEPLTLGQAGEMLDRLSYFSYHPGTENQQGVLWSQIEARVAAVQPLPTGSHLYRPPPASAGQGADPVRNDCPYAIPAYFRLWEAALSRHVRGLFVTGVREELWSMSNLALKGLQQPRFWVGIRYGASDSPAAAGPFDALPFVIHTTQRSVEDGTIKTTWGSNSPDASSAEYRGDEYFDYYHRGEPLPLAVEGEEPWRPVGSDGQILFYINKLPNQEHPTVAVGVCIPSGGPDQFSAVLQPARLPAGIRGDLVQ